MWLVALVFVALPACSECFGQHARDDARREALDAYRFDEPLEEVEAALAQVLDDAATEAVHLEPGQTVRTSFDAGELQRVRYAVHVQQDGGWALGILEESQHRQRTSDPWSESTTIPADHLELMLVGQLDLEAYNTIVEDSNAAYRRSREGAERVGVPSCNRAVGCAVSPGCRPGRRP